MGEAVPVLGQGVCRNSLYFPHNFAVNLKPALFFFKHQTLKLPGAGRSWAPPHLSDPQCSPWLWHLKNPEYVGPSLSILNPLLETGTAKRIVGHFPNLREMDVKITYTEWHSVTKSCSRSVSECLMKCQHRPQSPIPTASPRWASRTAAQDPDQTEPVARWHRGTLSECLLVSGRPPLCLFAVPRRSGGAGGLPPCSPPI